MIKEGDRVKNTETGEIGVVTYVHEVYPYKGAVTVWAGDGADLWELEQCEHQERIA